MPLLRVELHVVVSKYIGETEKNLATLFDAAEQAGAVLFFDQADGLFDSRTEVIDAVDRHANAVRGRLLRHVERYPGIVILGRTRIGRQDRAYLRAIPRVFVYPSRADMGHAL
jgi:SpoVK/Ycf46/Vps4 family AAA+-type ATPase